MNVQNSRDWAVGYKRLAVHIVTDSTGATESHIAHSISDKAAAIVTSVGLVVLMLAFDWRLGLLCFIPAVIGFSFMMTMMGETMKTSIEEYKNVLDFMSNEAMEYVRGIPVVKTFGQTVYSFRRFKNAIDACGKWTIAYTRSMRPSVIQPERREPAFPEESSSGLPLPERF